MSIKRISALNLCHVLKPFVKSTSDNDILLNLDQCVLNLTRSRNNLKALSKTKVNRKV